MHHRTITGHVQRSGVTLVAAVGLLALVLEGCTGKGDSDGSGGGTSETGGSSSTGSQGSSGGNGSGGSDTTGGSGGGSGGGADSSGGGSGESGGAGNAGGTSGSGGEPSASGGAPPVSCMDDFDCEGFTCCDGECVNLENDPENCGQCGVECEGETPYCASMCIARPCSASCDGGETCCGNACCGAGEICCVSTVGPAAPACTTPENGTCPLGCADCD